MKLEIGKYYRTRDGRKVGPIMWRDGFDEFDEPFVFQSPDGTCYSRLGENGDALGYIVEDVGDLIAEWADEPNDYQPNYEECMDAAYAKGMEYTPTKTGTLAELNVKTGDVVEAQWIGESTWHKYVYTENHPTLGQPCVMGSSGSYILVRDAHLWIWRIVSRASTPPSPVRTVTRKEIVPGVYGLVRVYGNGDVDMKVATTAAELTAAIETLTKIRDALA